MVKYQFGDIVREVKEKVDRNNNPYEYYIAGDHMDTDELHLLRRGVFEGSDVGPAFIRIFKPGQVLYGSRRTYLRKVAVADFEGITANTTFVLETKDESVLLQRLLPFIMQSDRFVQHSIKRSKGSTNPYVLFSDLADYEVDLPDIDKQKELADLLWAMDDVKMSYKKLISATDELVKSHFIDMFGDPSANTLGWPEMRLEDACIKLTDGTHFSPESFATGEYKYITAKHIKADGFDFSNLTYVPEAIHRPIFERCNPEYGDILYIKDGATTGIAMINTLKEEFTMLSSVALIKYNRHLLDGQYLKALLNYPTFYAIMRNNMGGAAITRLTVKKLCDTLIPVPPIDNQKQFSAFVGQSDKSKFELEQALAELNATYKRIIAENLG